jgi:signal peptidase I
VRPRRALIFGLVAGLLALAALRVFVLEVDRVSSPSMAPTLLVGDWLLVTRFDRSRLQRGDVIVFRSPADGEKTVKRVIGLPGDKVEDTGQFLQVNGEILPAESIASVSFDASGETLERPIPLYDRNLQEEHLGARRWQIAHLRESKRTPTSWNVPAGSCFVMGDNRDSSVDSRDPSVGPVPLGTVTGHVARVLFSKSPTGWRGRTWLSVP